MTGVPLQPVPELAEENNTQILQMLVLKKIWKMKQDQHLLVSLVFLWWNVAHMITDLINLKGSTWKKLNYYPSGSSLLHRHRSSEHAQATSLAEDTTE